MKKNKYHDEILMGMTKFICTAGVICICFILVDKYIKWINKSSQFNISNVEIIGNEFFTKEELLKECEYKENLSTWEIDLKKLNDNLEKNPFLENIKVYRSFPDKLIISLKEKKPIALLNINNNFLTLDKTGLVLPSKSGAMYDVPVISGDFRGEINTGHRAGGKQLKFSLTIVNKILAVQPDLYNKISEIVVNDKQNLIFYTSKNGIPVHMGKDNIEYKIQCLGEMLRKLKINGDFAKIKYIDLRYEDQIIVGRRT